MMDIKTVLGEFTVDQDGLEAILSIDPAGTSGIALHGADGELLAVELATVRTIDPFERVRLLKPLIDSFNPRAVVMAVEGQYLDPSKGFASAASIVRNAACWQTVGVMLGLLVVSPIAPSTWRASFGLARQGVSSKWRAAQQKQIVRGMYGKSFGNASRTGRILHKSVDVHCAVLIGAHMGHVLNPEAFQWVESERASRMTKAPVRVRKNRRAKDAATVQI